MKKLEKKQEKFDKKDESKPTCVKRIQNFLFGMTSRHFGWRHVTSSPFFVTVNLYQGSKLMLLKK